MSKWWSETVFTGSLPARRKPRLPFCCAWLRQQFWHVALMVYVNEHVCLQCNYQSLLSKGGRFKADLGVYYLWADVLLIYSCCITFPLCIPLCITVRSKCTPQRQDEWKMSFSSSHTQEQTLIFWFEFFGKWKATQLKYLPNKRVLSPRPYLKCKVRR